ncbi:glycosyltransferase family 4 protein [Pyxidicoccus sp. MSG2]|uniref:glycosyltransferase family 4 protein n=1 Tax=Pyxidicoccus sp. MSG2 TaxID=2996790 RepID=UPI00226F9D3B|nr:glycosyltransferase [Pyxidicoccus sp. MSG2]MCY1020837.1 glycosyltransferase [Pyxidicoccus sp. MSG2]
MRILLANHHLDQRAGSELYCLELATALTRAGHQVALFTFRPGAISEEFRRRDVRVFSVTDDAAIEAFDPEVLHVHHAPCLYFLGALRLRAPVVFSSLGVLPALEGAPIVWAGVAHALAVSEEVREALTPTPFGAAVPVSLCRNWFDDTGLEKPAAARARPARRIAVVTNHLDPRLKEDLDAVCRARPEVSWTHLGLPHHSTEITPELLRDFDRVVSIGRTPLLAAALQIPCLLYDVHGCDGLLSVEHFDAQARVNFSGRHTRARPSREELGHLLFEEAERLDVAAVADRLWSEHRLSGRAQELVSLYEQARAGGTSLGDTTRAAYGRTGRAYADAVDPRHPAHVAYLEQQAAAAQELAQARQAHITGVEQRAAAAEELAQARLAHISGVEQRAAAAQELAQARQAHITGVEQRNASLSSALEAETATAVRLRGELAQAQARIEQQATALDQARARIEQQGAELEQLRSALARMEAHVSWRIFTALRTAKERVVPPGTRRLALYNQVRQRLHVAVTGEAPNPSDSSG